MADSNEVLRVSREEMMQCSFPRWYHDFEKVTPLSFIIPLPNDFIEYLLSDGTLRLPGKPYQWAKEQGKKYRASGDNDDSDSSDISWSDVDDEDELGEGATDVPSFEKLSRCVSKKIRKLGGRCFPKLDWSCPKDASWIGLNNSLSCSTFVDICLLLKSSTFVTHDLIKPFEYCHPCPSPVTSCDADVTRTVDADHQDARVTVSSPVIEETTTAATNSTTSSSSSSTENRGTKSAPLLEHNLILRKWVEIEPSFEFRCFVRDKSFIAISQRETSQYYSYIGEQKNQIVGDIVSFFKEYIKKRFPLENYTFDVYRSRKDYVRLLDFNPFCSQTDALLFDWKELQELQVAEDRPEFRYHTDNVNLQPSSYREYALPADVREFASASGTEQLLDLVRIQDIQQSQKKNATTTTQDAQNDESSTSDTSDSPAAT